MYVQAYSLFLKHAVAFRIYKLIYNRFKGLKFLYVFSAGGVFVAELIVSRTKYDDRQIRENTSL